MLAPPVERVASETCAPVLISMRGLRKRYPVRRRIREIIRHPLSPRYVDVVKGVTCDVREGEFFGLLGPNGAGKSTLFRLLAMVVLPDEGSATIAGGDLIHDAQELRSRVALVSADERSLNWRLSAHENLRFFGALQGLTSAETRSRIGEVLNAVELEDAGQKLVGAFSSGMKQRLLIARALLSDPQVLLLDEPTRSLDPIAARRFRQFLRDEISVRRGCTVLLATHNAEEALELCDRSAVLHRGRLLAVDSPRQLSRFLGDERYQVWTRTPHHAAFSRLVADARVTKLTRSEAEGWGIVEFAIPGGDDAAVDVLASLARASVGVGRFQKVQPALADVLEHVVAHSAEEAAS